MLKPIMGAVFFESRTQTLFGSLATSTQSPPDVLVKLLFRHIFGDIVLHSVVNVCRQGNQLPRLSLSERNVVDVLRLPLVGPDELVVLDENAKSSAVQEHQ